MARFSLGDEEESSETFGNGLPSDDIVESSSSLANDAHFINSHHVDVVPDEICGAEVAREEIIPAFPSRRRQEKKSLFWVSSVLFVLVAWGWGRHLPPAPPPSSSVQKESWRDYLWHHSSQFAQSFVALAVETPLYVGSWWCQGIYVDVQLWLSDMKSQMAAGGPRLATDLTSTAIRKKLQQQIVGQDLAIAIVADALEAWIGKRSYAGEDLPPVCFFFAGFSSVGKRTLALALINVIYDSSIHMNDLILTISGGAFLNSDPLVQDTQMELMNRFARHTRRFPRGSVIVIEDVDLMSRSIFRWLSYELGNGFKGGSQSPENPEANDFAKLCANTVFVFTSNSVGNSSVLRFLRESGKENMESHTYTKKLLADVGFEISDHFDMENALASVRNIIPFVPLTRESLKEILHFRFQKLSDEYAVKVSDSPSSTMHSKRDLAHSGTQSPRWRHMRVTDRLMDALLSDSVVEYLEWKRNDLDSQDLFMKVALDGAQNVLGSHCAFERFIVPHVISCFDQRPPTCCGRKSLGTRNVEAIVDLDHDHAVFMWCDLENCCHRSNARENSCFEVCRVQVL